MNTSIPVIIRLNDFIKTKYPLWVNYTDIMKQFPLQNEQMMVYLHLESLVMLKVFEMADHEYEADTKYRYIPFSEDDDKKIEKPKTITKSLTLPLSSSMTISKSKPKVHYSKK